MSEARALSLGDVAAGRAPAHDGWLYADVDAKAWTGLALGCAAGAHDLSALWHDHGRMRLALLVPSTGQRLVASLALDGLAYPSVGRWHAPALRLERAMRDLYAVDPVGLPDTRPWLDHGRWPRSPSGVASAVAPEPSAYRFLPVEGESLHQIPVGPVHAGIIEPGHFRFTANGEAVVRLEERLGYVHKGIETQCRGADIATAARIVARVSGDSTVAYSFAFARAVEAALGVTVPERAVLLRAVMAELERISHHVNDVGAICNDASVVALQARCTLIREDVLQTAAACFGHRLLMDRIVPGGVAADLPAGGADAIVALLQRIEAGFATVVKVYDSMPSLQDRTVTTGIVRSELAARFAAGGHVGRASGRDFDSRRHAAYPPYDSLDLKVPTRTAGDVDARVWVRIEEVAESCRIVRVLLGRLAPGPVLSPLPAGSAGEAVALAEAFRGDVLIAVRLDAAGSVAHLHARDASWFQWPLLEAAIEGNIVADFPLCNKSFNCSYSGHDL